MSNESNMNGTEHREQRNGFAAGLWQLLPYKIKASARHSTLFGPFQLTFTLYVVRSRSVQSIRRGCYACIFIFIVFVFPFVRFRIDGDGGDGGAAATAAIATYIKEKQSKETQTICIANTYIYTGWFQLITRFSVSFTLFFCRLPHALFMWI